MVQRMLHNNQVLHIFIILLVGGLSRQDKMMFLYLNVYYLIKYNYELYLIILLFF
jgi:hypothetical protein